MSVLTVGQKGSLPVRQITKNDLIRVELPLEYWEARVAKIQSEEVRKIVLNYCHNIIPLVQKGYGIIFLGERGVGKTAAAATVLKAALTRYLSPFFISYSRLRDIQFEDSGAMYGNWSDGITVKDMLTRADLLVLDGFNISFFSDKVFTREKLSFLLEKRMQSKKPTIMTANFGAAIKDSYHDDLRGVIESSMQVVKIVGRDMREERRENMRKAIFGE